MSTATELYSEPTQLRGIVAENVRMEAARLGHNQSSIARALGMNQPQINRRWRGAVAWTLDELEQLSEIFDVNVLDLMQSPRRWVSPMGTAAPPAV